MTRIVKQEVEVASRTGKGVKINGEWYNSKFPVFNAVSKGTVVSFEYTEGSSGGLFVKGEVTVDTEATVASSSSPGGKRRSASSSDYGLGAAVGMAINNAIALCLAEKGSYDLEYVKKKAVAIYQLSEEFKVHAANGLFDPVIEEEEEVPEEETTTSEEGDDESPSPF